MPKQYATELGQGIILRWKPLKWGEYRKITKQLSDLTGPATWLLYDTIAGLCLIDFDYRDVEDYDELPAGLIQQIGEIILSQTGFVPEENLINTHLAAARDRVQNNYYTSGEAIICAAFHWKRAEVDLLTLEEFLDMLVMAEAVLGININIADKSGSDEQPMIDVKGPGGKVYKVPLNTKQSLRRRNKVELGKG